MRRRVDYVMHSLSAINKYFSPRRLSLALFFVNVIGAIAYELAASPTWAIPEERAAGIHSVTGEPFIWAALALPILVGFTLLNVVWGTCLCVQREWRSGYLWLATAVVWLIAIWVDFAHH